jgi:hypothetical protein
MGSTLLLVWHQRRKDLAFGLAANILAIRYNSRYLQVIFDNEYRYAILGVFFQHHSLAYPP